MTSFITKPIFTLIMDDFIHQTSVSYLTRDYSNYTETKINQFDSLCTKLWHYKEWLSISFSYANLANNNNQFVTNSFWHCSHITSCKLNFNLRGQHHITHDKILLNRKLVFKYSHHIALGSLTQNDRKLW